MLIDKSELLKVYDAAHKGPPGGARKLIEEAPAVEAVPVDKLCEWLNVYYGRPNYCNDRLCGECNLDGEAFEYEPCWKTLLKEWMEEHNGTDNP